MSTLVDGTLLPALPKLVEAMWLDDRNKAFKLHTQFELLNGVPVRMDLTTGNTSEREVLAAATGPSPNNRDLTPGKPYAEQYWVTLQKRGGIAV